MYKGFRERKASCQQSQIFKEIRYVRTSGKSTREKSQMETNGVSQMQNNHAPTSRFVDKRPEAIQMRKLRELAKTSPQNAKLRELQQLNAAHSVTQKKSDGKQGFRFEDNRPEAIAQRKLQETANNSPRTVQLRAFQDMAKNGSLAEQTLQLKRVANNKLNIVGRTTPESNARRPAERTIAENEAGGKYWLEHQFKEADGRSYFQQFWNPNQGQEKLYGDPPKLRVKHTAKVIANTIGMVGEFITGYGDLNDEERKALRNAVAPVIPWFRRMRDEVARVEGLNDDINDLSKAVETIRGIITLIIEETAVIDTSSFGEALATIQATESIENLTLGRSINMAKSAYKTASTLGIWKVGEKHIGEIEAATNSYEGASEANFEILTRDEFNTEYDHLPQFHQGHKKQK